MAIIRDVLMTRKERAEMELAHSKREFEHHFPDNVFDDILDKKRVELFSKLSEDIKKYNIIIDEYNELIGEADTGSCESSISKMQY